MFDANVAVFEPYTDAFEANDALAVALFAVLELNTDALDAKVADVDADVAVFEL